MVQLGDADAPDLKFSGDGRRGGDREGFLMDRGFAIVIRDKTRALVDQSQREVGFAAPGWATDQNSGAADGNASGVDQDHV